ncbi:protein THEM6-like [Centruroides sculpturatus]|uniref:protein THEM6-like n=1 Tax=Centruroides sculpturatus TaxID=218467 RepID=UPI000C6CC74B|nr:protein THEM6-like [Centruroides sculpturatus]
MDTNILYVIIGLLLLTLLFYATVEVAYFTRLLIGLYLYKLCYIRQKLSVNTEVHTLGMCLLTDMDFLFHMNHARYLREFEFSRMKYLLATDLVATANSLNADIVITGITIRYRRSIRVFDIYKISNKLIYWSGRDFYIEHRLTTRRDNFVRTFCIIKMTLTNGVTFEEVLKRLPVKSRNMEPPEPHKDLRCWLEFNKISSEKLKEEQKTVEAHEISV